MKRIAIIAGVAFAVLLVLLAAPSSIDKSKFTVHSVVDGNTLLLDNGYQIVLLGVAGGDNSMSYLQEFKQKKVRIIMDGSSPRLASSRVRDKRIYAYVKCEGCCLNSHILKEGLSSLCVMPNLVDSLENYMGYAGQEYVVLPDPDPDPDPEPNKREKGRGDGAVKPHKGTRANGWSIHCRDNCAMLEEVVDFKNPTTRNFAVNLASNSPGTYNFGQVCAIFDHLYNHWKYVTDPRGAEYVAKASESLVEANLSGDCDDFAVAMCACIIAIGGEARINTAYNATSGHAFTEVDVTGLSESQMRKAINKMFKQYTIGRLHPRVDDGRTWLNLDWQASYPGGPYYNYTECTTYSRQYGTSWSCK